MVTMKQANKQVISVLIVECPLDIYCQICDYFWCVVHLISPCNVIEMVLYDANIICGWSLILKMQILAV